METPFVMCGIQRLSRFGSSLVHSVIDQCEAAYICEKILRCGRRSRLVQLETFRRDLDGISAPQ
jgi:hypothetical protein